MKKGMINNQSLIKLFFSSIQGLCLISNIWIHVVTPQFMRVFIFFFSPQQNNFPAETALPWVLSNIQYLPRLDQINGCK